MESDKKIEKWLIEKWLDENTFYCEHLKCRLTEKMCEKLRSRVDIDDYLQGRIKLNKFGNTFFRPAECKFCKKNKKRNAK